ncbi:MAG: hypothetical protein AAFY88_03680, partial [Acidobacteriota bacterium]
MTAAVAADHQVQAERVLRNVSSALMQILVTSVAVLTMFLTFSYFSFRKDEKKRQDRRSIDLEEFAKAEGFESIKAPVLQAVFAELSRTLGYPPVASDLIGSDLGIDGSDIDDLILSLSDKLQIIDIASINAKITSYQIACDRRITK